MYSRISNYDDYSAEYAAYVAQREQGGVEDDPLGILPCLLEMLGDVAGRSVLDGGGLPRLCCHPCRRAQARWATGAGIQ